MKLSNNPQRKLERQIEALQRFKINGVRAATEKRPNPRTEEQAKAEKARLVEITAAMTLEFARGVKSKKDHSSRAKLRGQHGG